MVEPKKEIWSNLLNTAMKDGVITEEEEKLLKTILQSIEEFEKLLRKAKEDGIITEKEEEELFNLREKIWEKAYAVAKEDKNISIDEHEILIKLVRMLSDLKIK